MILIYLNSKGIYGGVEMLAHRFALYLKSKDIPFMIAEGADTRIARLHCEEVIVDPNKLQSFSNRVSHIFFPNFIKIRLADKFLPQFLHATILGWIVHPNEPFRSFYPFSSRPIDLLGYPGIRPLQSLLHCHTKRVHNLFEQAILNDGVITMDGATNRGLEYFFPRLSRMPETLPIPSPSSDFFEKQASETAQMRRIGYLGRLDGFKMSALRPFLTDYSKIEPFQFHLIGEGSSLPEVHSICKSNNIHLQYHGFKPSDEAKRLLLNNTDFAVAMGTAALDVAGAGLPCVILDPAIKKCTPSQRKFRFVHEIEDYTIGEYRDFPMYRPGLHSIDDLAAVLYADCQVGKKGREYVSLAHNPEDIFGRLLNKVRSSRLAASLAGELASEVNKSFQQIKFYSKFYDK